MTGHERALKGRYRLLCSAVGFTKKEELDKSEHMGYSNTKSQVVLYNNIFCMMFSDDSLPEGNRNLSV